MKIAVHKTRNGFDTRWIEYCKKNNIDYKVVDCYSNDIIAQLTDCDVLMWHYHHASAKDVKFAKQLLFSLQQAGKSVFPDFNTTWHFDDKVGQKYLLEAIGAPLVPSYVFYNQEDAMAWVERTIFPKVFKLRGGAGSYNVLLARTKKRAKQLVKKSFKGGFSQYSPFSNLQERWYHYKKGQSSFLNLLKGLMRIFYKPPFARMVGNEKGYAYFQEFMPNNSFDIRIVVIGDKAFALKRLTREGDFRASGSGNIVYDVSQIDERCVSISFETSDKLQAQCIAYDYVFNEQNEPLIVEISYGFAIDAYDDCEGYWTKDMEFHKGAIDACGWMVDMIIKSPN